MTRTHPARPASRRAIHMLLGGVLLAPLSLAPVAALATRASIPTAHRAMAPLRSITLDGAVLRTQTEAAPPGNALRPAPLPDRDLAAPEGGTLASQDEASVEPGLFNPQNHFSGDGYAPGSSIEADHNHRHSTGGGMNLSIPVQ